MRQLKITIYKVNASSPDATIRIPLKALKIANSLIPKRVKEKMIDEGIDLKEIIKAMESGETSGTLAEIETKDERIVISAE